MMAVIFQCEMLPWDSFSAISILSDQTDFLLLIEGSEASAYSSACNTFVYSPIMQVKFDINLNDFILFYIIVLCCNRK
jgi:hypothetical protein